MYQQKRINQQKITQIQDQYHSNSILCEFLAMAESLAYAACLENNSGYPLPLKYDKYDYGNTKETNTYSMLLKKVKISYENFVSSFNDYRHENSAYKYPINLPVEDIIDDLSNFRQFLDSSGKMAFTKMIDFFANGKYSQVFDFGSVRNHGMDPVKIAGRFPVSNSYIHQGAERARDQYLQDGEYEFNAELNQRNDFRIKNQADHSTSSIQRANLEREARARSGFDREPKAGPYCHRCHSYYCSCGKY